MKAILRHRQLSVLALILFVLPISARASREEHMVSTWRPIHYEIVITLNDQLSAIDHAHVAISLQVLKDNLESVDLDFGELTVDALKLNDKEVRFDHSSSRLNVYLPRNTRVNDRFSVTVDYHGKPKDGLVLAADKDGKPSATGDNWPNRVHHWIPCLDHPSAKATVNFTVTAPARDLVVANGKLEQVTNTPATTRTWTYTESVPIPAYCMVIAVGEYAKFEPTHPAITPLAYYVPQSDSNVAVKGFSSASPSLTFFSQTVAPYPYEKLALIVGATRFGGMENSSAIVFSMNVLGPRRSPRTSQAFDVKEALEEVIAHEIAHQWFGDSVTESTWADLWLSEGFATYFAGLFVQKYHGEEAFQVYMKRAAEAYFAFEKGKRIPIHDTETENLMELLNASNYQKGGWVLHMLRSELGDEAFFAGLKTYYKENKESIASSKDLQRALEKASRRKLDTFFSSWIFKSGHPQYELSWTWLPNNKKVRLELRQLQPETAFPNRVPIEIATASEKLMITLEPLAKEFVREVKLPEAPVEIRVDPHNTILKDATVKHL